MFSTYFIDAGGRRAPRLASALAVILGVGCAAPGEGRRDGPAGGSGLDLPGQTGGTEGGGASSSRGAWGSSSGGEDGSDGAAGSSTGGPDSDSGSPPLFDLGGAGGDTGAPPTCDVVELDVAIDPPQIGFVLDFSGSMNGTTPYEGQTVTRWAALHGVVSSLAGSFADKVDFGAKIFPTGGACETSAQVEVAVAPDNQQGLLAGIPPAGAAADGSTPIGDGLDAMYGHLSASFDGRDQAVILVTDGATNCTGNSPDEVEARIAQAASAGVATYVVGFASGATDQLQTFAQAGGTALPGPTAYYDAADGDALSQAMEEIVLDAISCTLTLPQEPTLPEYVKVRVGATAWPEVDACGGLPGWTWSAEYSEITLCGAACDSLKQSGVATVEFACTAG